MEPEMPRAPWKHSSLLPTAIGLLAFVTGWAQLLCREELKGAMVGIALSLLVVAMISAIWLDRIADTFRQWAIDHNLRHRMETDRIRQTVASLSMRQSELGDALGTATNALGATKEELQSKLELTTKELSTKFVQTTADTVHSEQFRDLIAHSVAMSECTRLNSTMIDRTIRTASMAMMGMHVSGFLSVDHINRWYTDLLALIDGDLKRVAETISVIPADLQGVGAGIARDRLRELEKDLHDLRDSITQALALFS